MSENPYTMPLFMDALIASFVLHDISELSIVSERSERDRCGLNAMHQCAHQAVETQRARLGNEESTEWFNFLVQARNVLDPDRHNSFPELRSELIEKTVTLVNLGSPHDGTYHFGVSKPNAESILRQMHPNLRLYADTLVAAFVIGRDQLIRKTA